MKLQGVFIGVGQNSTGINNMYCRTMIRCRDLRKAVWKVGALREDAVAAAVVPPLDSALWGG